MSDCTKIARTFVDVFQQLAQNDRDCNYTWSEISAYLNRYRAIMTIYAAGTHRLTLRDEQRFNETRDLLSYVLVQIGEMAEETHTCPLIARSVRELRAISQYCVDGGQGWNRLALVTVYDTNLLLNKLIPQLAAYRPVKRWQFWRR